MTNNTQQAGVWVDVTIPTRATGYTLSVLPPTNEEVFCLVNGEKKVGHIAEWFIGQQKVLDYRLSTPDNINGISITNLKSFKWWKAATPAPDAVEAKADEKTIWQVIEHFQEMRESPEDTITYNELESELYGLFDKSLAGPAEGQKTTGIKETEFEVSMCKCGIGHTCPFSPERLSIPCKLAVPHYLRPLPPPVAEERTQDELWGYVLENIKRISPWVKGTELLSVLRKDFYITKK